MSETTQETNEPKPRKLKSKAGRRSKSAGDSGPSREPTAAAVFNLDSGSAAASGAQGQESTENDASTPAGAQQTVEVDQQYVQDQGAQAYVPIFFHRAEPFKHISNALLHVDLGDHAPKPREGFVYVTHLCKTILIDNAERAIAHFTMLERSKDKNYIMPYDEVAFYRSYPPPIPAPSIPGLWEEAISDLVQVEMLGIVVSTTDAERMLNAWASGQNTSVEGT